MHDRSGSAQRLADDAAAILEGMSDGFFSVDSAWKFVYLNGRAEGLLGASRAALVGKTLWEAFPALAGTAFEEAYRKAMREHGAAELTAYYPDHRRWYEVRIAPAAAGLSFYFRDVSAQVATQQALRESERDFRLMADSVPQIIWIVMASGEAVYFNRQWEDYTGVPIASSTPAEVANDFVHPDDLGPTMAAWAEAYAQQRGFHVQHRIRSRTGSYRWFLVRAEPVMDAAGAILRWFGTSTDIHEEKMVKLALEAAERRHAFQQALADRIRPLLDPEEVAAAACAMLGRYLGAGRVVYGEADDGGMQLDMKPDWTDGSLASMGGRRLRLEDFGMAVSDILRAGHKLVIDDVLRVDAAQPHLPNYMEAGIRAVLAVPLVKEGRMRAVLSVHDGAPHAWSAEQVAMAEDMVDRTWFAVESARAQAELRAERDQSRQIFDSMTEGFALLDSDWTVLQVNEIGAQLARTPRAALLGQELWTAIPQLLGSEVERLYRRVQAQALPATLEYAQALPAGGTAWLELRAYPLPGGRLAIFFRDIGERKAAEGQLREADRRKDDFLAMLAHELRNPLAPIGAAAHLLRVGRLDPDRVRHTSQIIGRQVDHMTHLVNDLLDVSRVTRGLVELESAPLDLRDVLADAAEQVAPLVLARRHLLRAEIAPEGAMVVGDKKRLVQVFANILNNAAKYTPEGGSITLSLLAQADSVCVDVADNGIGMAPQLVSHVFELFAQAERSSDRSAGGLGLGLALVRSLVELHGGTVSCHSAGPGLGSRFSVCLPRLAAAAADAGPDAAVPAMAAGGKGLRVLVVDDNTDAADMLGMVLEGLGHQVAVEYGSHAALARARTASSPPQVCLLDIGLPDIDGNELARRLQARPETADAVLVAVTGYGQESDRQSLDPAFAHHLVKPADIGRLAAILDGIARAERS